jgi:transporter family protein
MNWLTFALLSAFFAALTTVLAKIGVAGVPSTLATAIRTVVIAIIAWSLVVGLGEHHALPTISRRSLIYLAVSGVTTGLSWLAYFRALQLAPVSRVAPIDRLSLPLTVLLATIFLGEVAGWRVGLGVALMTGGAILTIS